MKGFNPATFDPGSATVVDAKRPAGPPPPGRWVVTILNFHPCPLNKLIGCHWAVAHARKMADQRRIAEEMALAGVPEAVRVRRRVSLRVVLGPRQRAFDPDAPWKSLLDALVACRRLVNDSRQWMELGTIEFERGKARATVLVIEDVVKP